MRARLTPAALLTALALVGGLAPAAWAAQYSLVPSLTTRLIYDDNILLRLRDRKADFIGEVRPAFLFGASTESSKLEAAGELNVQSFATHSEFDTVDQNYKLGATTQLTPRLSLSASGGYLKDTTLNEELTTGGFVLARNERQNYSGSGSVAWQAGERTDVSAAFSYQQFDYEATGLVDYEVEGVSGSLSHRLEDARTTLLFQPAYSRFAFGKGDIDSYQALAGLRYDFSERTSLQVLVGPVYTVSEWRGEPLTLLDMPVLDPFGNPIFLVPPGHDERWGWVASVEARRSWERGQVVAGYNQDITGSAYGEAIDRMHPYLDLTAKLTERLRAGLAFDYFGLKSERGEFVIRDYDVYAVSPSLAYALGEHADLALSYRYMRVNDHRFSESADRNLVYVQLRLFTTLDLKRYLP